MMNAAGPGSGAEEDAGVEEEGDDADGDDAVFAGEGALEAVGHDDLAEEVAEVSCSRLASSGMAKADWT